MRDRGGVAATERQLSAEQTTLTVVTPYISFSKIWKCAPRVQRFLQIYIPHYIWICMLWVQETTTTTKKAFEILPGKPSPSTLSAELTPKKL
jgi:hypothetical protein